ncbi:hypothetical protein OS493_010591 [Desmophyllum pertusum]|uniref:Uncharacterized protein n=1 Tax=Desmophyllum pertusum TaxID=174260 RepID=A0A9W9ZSH7_9CNID|nr:hypothetical protein OS493_010591 [Desmophyllum pertusum]
MAEDTKNKRHVAKRRFTRKLAELTKSIDKGLEVVRRSYDALNEAWRNFEAKHDVYTTFLEDSEVEGSEESVIPALRKIQQALEASLVNCKVASDKYFEFLSREEAIAKVGWILVVQKRHSQVADKTALHLCDLALARNQLAVVKGVDDDIKEMWKRLDEKYGYPAP